LASKRGVSAQARNDPETDKPGNFPGPPPAVEVSRAVNSFIFVGPFAFLGIYRGAGAPARADSPVAVAMTPILKNLQRSGFLADLGVKLARPVRMYH
jgi:hypothetical protein